MAMRDGSTLDIDGVLGQAERLGNGKRYGCERLVDFEALHIAEPPARTRKSDLDRGNRTETEHPGLNRGNAVRDEPHHGRDGLGVCKGTISNDHGCGAAVQPRCVTSCDGAALTEGRTQFCKALECRIGSRCLVGHERRDALLAPYFDRDNLINEFTRLLRPAEALLRAFGKTILSVARQLRLRDKVFGVPARVLARKRVVKAVPKHAVMNLSRAHAVP